jgi:hypothetical protein
MVSQGAGRIGKLGGLSTGTELKAMTFSGKRVLETQQFQARKYI